MTGRAHPPRIVMRADARPELGGGHITRCLALAEALSAQGAEVAFACNREAPAVVPRLADSGFQILSAERVADLPMPENWAGKADAAVIDLYDSHLTDETGFRQRARLLVVYEDLPERPHDCDVLIDQSLGASRAQYAKRIPSHTMLLLGPQYYAARPEFLEARPASLARRRSPHLKRILISMGLTDVRGISWQVARSVLGAFEGQIEVVLGANALSRQALEDLAAQEERLTITIEARDIALRMAQADLAIGAGGGTALERCILGLPSLVIAVADNQLALANHLHDRGAAQRISPAVPIETSLPEALGAMTPEKLEHMSRRAMEIADGDGANRLAATILARL